MTTMKSQLHILLPLKVTPVNRDLETDLLSVKRDLLTLHIAPKCQKRPTVKRDLLTLHIAPTAGDSDSDRPQVCEISVFVAVC